MERDEAGSGIVVRIAGITDRGLKRQRNEDAFALVDLSAGEVARDATSRVYHLEDRGALLMVADGMGGAAGGAVASEMAIETILAEVRHRWISAADCRPETFAAALGTAVERANAQIHDFAAAHPAGSRMGTTATVAGVLDDTVYLAQIGDSRAYVIREGRAHQITKDQSLVQELIEAGELTVAEAETSEHRHIILQALGPEPGVKVDLTRQRLRRGDVLVLCTDGLSGMVTDEEIAEEVRQAPDPGIACRRLVDRANERGGPDNITVIVARVDGPGLTTVAEGDDVGHQPYIGMATNANGGDRTPSAVVLPGPRQSGGHQFRWSTRVASAIAAVLVMLALLLAVTRWL